MRRTTINLRVVIDHDPDDGEYHEWVTLGDRVKADCLGRSNPRMWDRNWTKWICNSGECTAWALVSDDLIRDVLDSASRNP